MATRDTLTDRLGLRHPIVQGPFGGGLSTIELAAAVSNLGGLGSFGAHQLAPQAIIELAAQLRARTSAPFALNLWISDHDPGGLSLSEQDFDRYAQVFEPVFAELGVPRPQPPTQYAQRYDEQIDAILEARPPVFSFVFGVPTRAVLEACRAREIATIGAATSIAEAQALEAAGVDAIVATGFEAGGHRPSFLASAEASLMGTFVLTQLVSARVRTPVIAAGGIVDQRGIAAAHALGAQGAQLGTAFLACRESGATDAHRAMLFSDAAQRTTLTRAFTGRLARGIRNRWTDELAPQPPRIAPFPVQSWFMAQLRGAAIAANRTDLLALWCGQIAPNLRHRSAAELFASLLARDTPKVATHVSPQPAL
jgi:nitronate monooxygenase